MTQSWIAKLIRIQNHLDSKAIKRRGCRLSRVSTRGFSRRCGSQDRLSVENATVDHKVHLNCASCYFKMRKTNISTTECFISRLLFFYFIYSITGNSLMIQEQFAQPHIVNLAITGYINRYIYMSRVTHRVRKEAEIYKFKVGHSNHNSTGRSGSSTII